MKTTATGFRQRILDVIGANPSGHTDVQVREQVCDLLDQYCNSITDACDPVVDDDVILHIGTKVFGYQLPATAVATETTVDVKELPKESQVDVEVSAEEIVTFDYLKQFIKDIFISYGVPEDRADVCSDILVEADKRGIDSHGLGRLKPIYCDRMDEGILFPSTPITVIKETETTALLDANLGLGLYVGHHAMQLAIRKAKEHGMGFVAVQNSTHYGISGYYATMATEAGCIGFTGTNARPSVAPTFGVEPMLGTNPLCFGIPTDDPFPFVIDCATSISQRGKIEKYVRDGADTPKGTVVDNDGIERTDTEGILRDMVLGKCALCPLGGAGNDLGGYKGYGWGTVVELMCTAFQSGPFGEDICGVDRETGKPKPMPLGHYFFALDIEHLCPLDDFRRNASNFLRALRASKKSPLGPGRIWTAGEIEHDVRLQRAAGLKVPKALQQNMIELRNERPGMKEKYPQLPFEKC